MTEPTTELPRVLYKYRSWGIRTHRKSLRNRTVFFSSPKRFNDPFDCMVHQDYSLLTKDQIRERSLGSLERLGRPEEAQTIRKYFESASIEEIRRALVEGVDSQRVTELKNTIVGVLSLTPSRDNMLMWSHYANHHHGFCVGYSTAILANTLVYSPMLDNVITRGFPVHYLPDYPVIDPSDPDDPSWLIYPNIVKADLWKYEEEFRFIVLGKTDIEVELPPEAIAEVIFGHWMTDHDTESILKCLIQARLRPRLFVAQKKPRQFGLDIMALDK